MEVVKVYVEEAAPSANRSQDSERVCQLPEMVNAPALSGAGLRAPAGVDGVWHGATAATSMPSIRSRKPVQKRRPFRFACLLAYGQLRGP
jgi:hypothetical protein